MKTMWLSIVALFAVSIIPAGSCIKCYVCNSHVDPKCMDGNISPLYLVDCNELGEPHFYDRCRKIVQWTDYASDEEPVDQRYVRTCGYNQTGDRIGCFYVSYPGADRRTCTCLDEDGCNSSTSVFPEKILFLLSIYICLFIFTKF